MIVCSLLVIDARYACGTRDVCSFVRTKSFKCLLHKGFKSYARLFDRAAEIILNLMQGRGCVVFLAKYQIIIETNQVTLQGIGLTVLYCFQASRPF